jgi:hypothetical protein
MAITLTDNRIVVNQADAITGWTATDGPVVFTTGPTPIEATGCLAMQASNETQDAYVTITTDNYSLGGSLFVWMTNRAAFDTTVNGGVGIVVGDGTNRIAYHVGGSDGTGFRHDEGPVDWVCFKLDLGNKPPNFTTLTGAEGSLNEAGITQVGVYFKTIAKSVGGADNVFWDIIRFADAGVGIEVSGGTSGVPETWEQVTIEDRSTATLRAHGIIRKVGLGAYSIQGNISIGDATGTANTYINSDGETFLWEDRRQSNSGYYRFNAVGNGTGITDINFDDCVWTCPTEGRIDVSDANVDAFDVRNTKITGFFDTFSATSIHTGGASNDWSGSTFSGCGLIVTTGTDLRNCTFKDYPGGANGVQFYWNTTTDPNGKLDGCSFTAGASTSVAIQFPATMTNQSITLTDIDFIGYSAVNGGLGNTFFVLATTGTLTINISGGSGNTTYTSAGATVVIVNSVTVTLTGLQDNSEVRVMEAGSNTVELAGIEAATDGVSGARTFSFSLSAGTSVDIYIVNVLYENIEIEGYTIPSSATSLPQQQRFDRSYRNP